MSTEDCEQALDLQQIAMLRGLRKGALLPQLITAFRPQAQGLIAAIEAAIASGDMAALQNAAHALKSASFSLGAKPVGEVCFRLESSARGRLSLDNSAELDVLKRRHAALLRALEALQ